MENTARIVLAAEDRASGPMRNVTRSMGDMGRESRLLTGLLGGLTGALSVGVMTSAIKANLDYADSIAKMSQRVGISVKDLGSWQLAADLGGASIESVAKGVKGLSTYTALYGDKLKAAGIDTHDANKAIVQLADIFHDMPDGMEKTALAVTLFGKAGMDMIPMLNLGSEGLEEVRDRAKEYGERLAILAPQAEIFNDQLTELALQSKSAGINMTTYFMPGLIGATTWLNDMAAGGERARQAMEWFNEKTPANMGKLFKPDPNGWGLAGLDPVTGRALGSPDVSSPPDAPKTPDAEQRIAAAMARYKVLIDKINANAKAGTQKATSPIDVFGGGSFITRDKATAESIKESYEFENWAYGEIHKDQLKAIEATERQRQKYVEMADPLQKYREQLAEINRLRELGAEQGGLSAGQTWAAQLAVNEAMDKQIDKLNEVGDTGDKTFDRLTSAVEGWGREFTDTMTDAAMTGEADFSRMADSIIRDLYRIQIQKRVTDPLVKSGTSFIDTLFGGGGDGGASAAIASATAANGGFFPYFAEGGDHAGGWRVVGERGPELEATGPARIFDANQTRQMLGGGNSGGNNVTVNIIESPNAGGQVKQRNEGGRSIIDVMVAKVKGELIQDVRSDGAFARTAQGQWGLSRAAGAM